MQEQIDKQQRKQQQQNNDRNWQLFNEMWRDCFDSRIKQRCIDALAYPNINDADASRLRERYNLIEHYEQSERDLEEARRQAASEEQQREERERREQLYRERLAREAHEREERRAEERRRDAEERSRVEEARRLERDRRAAAEREARDYASAVSGCRGFDLADCNRALASPRLTSSDEADLRTWRATADAFGNDKQACKAGSAEACTRAIASPAVEDPEPLKALRAKASLYYRALGYYETSRNITLAYADTYWNYTRRLGLDSWVAVRDLPTSTHIAGGVALLSTTIAGAALYTRRPAKPREKRQKTTRRGIIHRARRKLYRLVVERKAARRKLFAQQPPSLSHHLNASAVTSPTTATPEQRPPQLPVPVATAERSEPIDTPAAHRAIRLAIAYLDELNAGAQNFGDEQEAKTTRTTLSLVAKQLDIAHQADPNAVLEADDVRMTQPEMRCETLVLEAKSWFPHNQSKAIDIIQRAKAHDPNSVKAWFWSGWFNYEQRNRDAAVTDLERALSLDPDHIEAMKLLDRAQNLGAAEIAVFKVANARDNTIIGVQKTVSILRIPFLIVSFPFRAIYWLGRAIYVSWTDPWRAARGDF